MSSVRVLGSLRRPANLRAINQDDGIRVLKDGSVAAAMTAAFLLGASPAAIAQSTQTLPQVTVEGKKSAPKKKAANTKAAPAAKAASTPQQLTPDEKIANPYANKEAPYKVEQSASGKLTEPLLDTPKTVTAIGKEAIEDQGAKDLRDLARSVPGLTIGSAEGGNAYGAFAVRGFKANNDIFVDSIRNPGNLIPDVFSVEQVEVYKGPSSGIAGRGTIGGAVNIITKQPVLNSNFGEVTTTVGTDNTFRTTLDVNQSVSPTFAFRANLMYDQHDIAGRDITDSERWGGLISFTAKPSDNLKFTLDYYRYRNSAIPDWGVPVIKPHQVPETEFGLPRNTWVGMTGLDFFKERADIVTATVVAKLADGVKLTNKSRAGQSELDYVATSMEGAPDVHHPNRDQTADIYANQTELNAKFATGTFKHNLVAGVEVTREKIRRDGYAVSNKFDTPSVTGFPRPFPGGLYDPFYTDVIEGKGRVYDATIDTVGAYLTDTIHLSKQWILNAGIRFDNFERDQKGGPGAPTATGGAVQNPATNIANNTAKVQQDLLSWNVGIVYKPIPIASFYAAYATAESPIGSELDANGAQYNGLSPFLVSVPPQRARSVEIGTKWELFNKRLLATAALFQTDVDHARTNVNVNAATPDPARAFRGEYRVRGIELGLAGNITRNWSVFGGLVLLDTEVLKSVDDQDVGRRLANIPLAQFSLLSRYQLTEKFAVAGAATYGGEVWAGHLAANAGNLHTVDWWRFDAFAEYKLTDNIDLKISGINLTNELYYDAIYQAGAANTDPGTFAFVAPGRAGYLTVKVKY
jgi:catecholate siderophore receptor